jgi:hypothetical protein
MKRAFVVAATCLSLAVAAVELTPTPAAAGTFSFSFGFGGPGFYPYHSGPFYPRPFYPRPFYGSPYPYQYQFQQPHQVCYPVVKLRKVVRHHRVHWRKVVVTVCQWRRW